MRLWRTPVPEPPTLAQMCERGPLVLCLGCMTFRTTVPALVASAKASGMTREVVEAHDADGRLCRGAGAEWESLRGDLESVVPVVTVLTRRTH